MELWKQLLRRCGFEMAVAYIQLAVATLDDRPDLAHTPVDRRWRSAHRAMMAHFGN